MAGSKYEYFETRTQEEINENILLDKQEYLKTNKKILLIGLDGVEIENVISIINKNNLFLKTYQIQNHESVKGWTSILYGNIFKLGKNIFTILNENKLKTAFICNWIGFENEILNPSEITFYQNADQDGKFVQVNGDQDFQIIKKIIDKGYEQCANLLKQKNDYDFIFYYDVCADEVAHQGYDYQTPLIKNIFSTYYEDVNNLIQLAFENNYDVLITTDHGRNPDNLQHEHLFLENRKSFLATNLDLLDFDKTSIFDIKKIVVQHLLEAK